MIGRQRCADFIIGNNWKVDQETKHAGPQKIPKSDRNEEHDRPEMRESGAGLAMLERAELQETPGLNCEKRQRNYLGRRKECPERHMLSRCARKINMMHRADHAASRVQYDVQVDQRERHAFMHDPQQHEYVGDHDCGEEFEKIFDPQMHNPEPPEFGGSKMRRGPRKQSYRVKRRNGESGEEEQPRHVALVVGRQRAVQSPEQQDYPKEQPDEHPYLPESSQIYI